MNPRTDLAREFDAVWTAQSGRHARAGVFAGVARVAAWRARLDDAEALLDKDERARARRMKRPRDAEARILAYALHRLLLGRLLAIDPREVPLIRDPHGRPHLPGIEPWQASLSHADGAVAFAASRAGAVGIDIEHQDRAADTLGIVDEILHPSEHAATQELDRRQHGRVLLGAWVRKEAYLKACGIGLAQSMSAFVLPDGGLLPARSHDGVEAGPVLHTRLVAALPDYVVALSCAAGATIGVLRLEPA